jgi:hypothetical protein
MPVLDARVYASAHTPIDTFLAEYLALTLVEHIELDPMDVNPYFDVYALDAAETLEVVRGSFTVPEGEAVFGDAIELEGYTAHATGEDLIVGTLWEVRDPMALGPVPRTQYAHDVVIFVQALDQGGQVAAQQDILGYPATSWEAGESFLHIHHLELAPSDEVTLLIGLYIRPEIARLPLALNGEAAGDALRVVVPSD